MGWQEDWVNKHFFKIHFELYDDYQSHSLQNTEAILQFLSIQVIQDRY